MTLQEQGPAPTIDHFIQQDALVKRLLSNGYAGASAQPEEPGGLVRAEADMGRHVQACPGMSILTISLHSENRMLNKVSKAVTQSLVPFSP